jgi:hypothetical protein
VFVMFYFDRFTVGFQMCYDLVGSQNVAKVSTPRSGGYAVTIVIKGKFINLAPASSR